MNRESNLSGLLLAVIAGMFMAVRPLAGQFAPYTGLSAFANFFAILFVLAAGICVMRKPSVPLPRGFVLLAAAWAAMFVWGAWRSPFIGEGLPQASDALLYLFVLLGGIAAGLVEPALSGIVIRITIAMAAVEAFMAICQIHFDLPRLRAMVESGALPLIDSLKGNLGQLRLYGDNAFGTFVNPNSLAAFLIVGMCLLLGHAVSCGKRMLSIVTHSLLGALMLWGFFWTDSKGGGVAVLAGLWFFGVQRIKEQRARSILSILTAAGVAALLAILMLGYFEIIPSRRLGLSIQVRLEYWKAAAQMIARHPLGGVGLSGYGEWYSTFKTPLGWESGDPHNDYVWLLAELGIFAPLIYAGMWWVILRRKSEALPPQPNPLPRKGEGEQQDSEFSRDKRGEWGVIACAAIMLLLALLNFTVFNADELINVINGTDRSAGAIRAAVEAAVVPGVFAVVALLLQTCWRGSTLSNESKCTALGHGLRAAAGAILLHQLVDFDFKSQGVMCALMVPAGMLLARAQTALGAQASSLQLGSRASSPLFAAALIVAALLAIPVGVYLPIVSGIPREEAENKQTELKRLADHPEELAPGESIADYRKAIVAARRRARDAAPFDAQAEADLARALSSFDDRAGASELSDEMMEHLEAAMRFRPLNSSLKAWIGSVYFRRAVSALKQGRADAARGFFEKARAAYAEAAALYLLNPGLALMEGDALVMLGEREQADARFWDAFKIDMRINDPNVYIAAIFFDPRPGVFARHGKDDAVFDELKKIAETTPGNLLRRIVGECYALNNLKRPHGDEDEKRVALKKKILTDVSTLFERCEKPDERAHAAFLLAICQREFGSKADADAARAMAIELQRESEQRGTPGTAKWIFEKSLEPVKRELRTQPH